MRNTAKLTVDVPQLKAIISKSWGKEDELKGLKSELPALDRKITAEFAPKHDENDGEEVKHTDPKGSKQWIISLRPPTTRSRWWPSLSTHIGIRKSQADMNTYLLQVFALLGPNYNIVSQSSNRRGTGSHNNFTIAISANRALLDTFPDECLSLKEPDYEAPLNSTSIIISLRSKPFHRY